MGCKRPTTLGIRGPIDPYGPLGAHRGRVTSPAIPKKGEVGVWEGKILIRKPGNDSIHQQNSVNPEKWGGHRHTKKAPEIGGPKKLPTHSGGSPTLKESVRNYRKGRDAPRWGPSGPWLPSHFPGGGGDRWRRNDAFV